MVRHSKCSTNTARYYNGGVWLLTVLDHLRIVMPSSGFRGEPVWVNVGTTGIDEAWAILPNLRGMNLLILLFICRLRWVTDVWGGVGWWLEWEMPTLGSCIGELHPQLKALSGKLTELSEDGVLLQEVCCWVQALKIYSFACFCSLSISCVWMKTWAASFLLQPSCFPVCGHAFPAMMDPSPQTP